MVSASPDVAWNFERVAGPFNGGAGGLAWDGSGVLFALPGAMVVKRFDPRSGEVSDWRQYTGRVNALAMGRDGAVYACQEGGRRVIRYLPDGTATTTALRLGGRIHNHPNDLVVDSRQRIWFADPHGDQMSIGPQVFPPLDHASVLRIEHDERHNWTMVRVTFDTVAPRAVLLSADERTLYVAEGDLQRTAQRELRAYEVRDDGSVGGYDVLHVFARDRRGPHRGVEGMALAQDGAIVACAGGAAAGPGPVVLVFDAGGVLRAGYPFPGGDPVRCAFGGAGLEDLYLTGSDGCLYRVRQSGLRGR